MRVWRLGHASAPCGFPPPHLYAWNHRFDDPKREYRTIYSAQEIVTCLREVLADFRPNKKALAEFEKIFAADPADEMPLAQIPTAWHEQHVLVQAEIVCQSGRLAEIEADRTLRLLGLGKSDIPAIRGKDRDFTRRLSRRLFDAGAAGVAFRSRLDQKPCQALFEGRASLRQLGQARVLSAELEGLIAVCEEYGLTLG